MQALAVVRSLAQRTHPSDSADSIVGLKCAILGTHGCHRSRAFDPESQAVGTSSGAHQPPPQQNAIQCNAMHPPAFRGAAGRSYGVRTRACVCGLQERPWRDAAAACSGRVAAQRSTV
jgi:hypothetical protein